MPISASPKGYVRGAGDACTKVCILSIPGTQVSHPFSSTTVTPMHQGIRANKSLGERTLHG